MTASGYLLWAAPMAPSPGVLPQVPAFVRQFVVRLLSYPVLTAAH